MTKKICSFVTLLLLATTFKSHSMENPNDQKTSEGVERVGDFLLGSTQLNPVEEIMFYFTGLPAEDASHIASFLITNKNAQSLEVVAMTINSLAQVNTQLNKLINGDNFCLQLIKHLAKKFNCSDETAAMALRTEGAKKRLKYQRLFEGLFKSVTSSSIQEVPFNKKQFDGYYKRYQKYIDLNFTYKSSKHKDIDHKYTLLLFAAEGGGSNGIEKVKWLLNTKVVDINCTSTLGDTVLIFLVFAHPDVLKLLCSYPGIDINHKANNGNTALMTLCNVSSTPLFNPENMQILLDAGANPTIATNNGTTPLRMVQHYRNPIAIKMIEKALINFEKNKK
jgi:hypothetical protein